MLINILVNIPIILVVFLLFLLYFNLTLRKRNKAQAQTEEDFWERERAANATRRKDISNLNYIQIPEELLAPPIPDLLPPKADYQAKLTALSQEKILNLTGYTNTDLKLEYGAANLETLSACDDNFTELVTTIDGYSKELLSEDSTKEEQDLAYALLEFAVSIEADAKPIYIRLAKHYLDQGKVNSVEDLITKASSLRSLSKNSIVADLNSLLQ